MRMGIRWDYLFVNKFNLTIEQSSKTITHSDDLIFAAQCSNREIMSTLEIWRFDQNYSPKCHHFDEKNSIWKTPVRKLLSCWREKAVVGDVRKAFRSNGLNRQKEKVLKLYSDEKRAAPKAARQKIKQKKRLWRAGENWENSPVAQMRTISFSKSPETNNDLTGI